MRGGSYFPDRDWQPIATYDGSLALLRSAERGLFGALEDGEWCEMVDGETHPIKGFEPTEWAAAPDEEVPNFA